MKCDLLVWFWEGFVFPLYYLILIYNLNLAIGIAKVMDELTNSNWLKNDKIGHYQPWFLSLFTLSMGVEFYYFTIFAIKITFFIDYF